MSEVGIKYFHTYRYVIIPFNTKQYKGLPLFSCIEILRKVYNNTGYSSEFYKHYHTHKNCDRKNCIKRENYKWRGDGSLLYYNFYTNLFKIDVDGDNNVIPLIIGGIESNIKVHSFQFIPAHLLTTITYREYVHLCRCNDTFYIPIEYNILNNLPIFCHIHPMLLLEQIVYKELVNFLLLNSINIRFKTNTTNIKYMPLEMKMVWED